MAANDGIDRISSLPEDSLIHILSFLPMKPAVRTGILSKRWRHLWKFNPVIDFSGLPSYAPVDEPDVFCLRDDDPLDMQIADYSFVSKCLELSRATKWKRLVIHRNTLDFFSEVEYWVVMAEAKDVEEIQLRFLFFERFHTTTPALFAVKSLKNLHLFGVGISSEISFSNLVLLKDLYIGNSLLRSEVVEAIVSSCPLLENFTLDSCYGLTKVKIAGPSLRLKRLVIIVRLSVEPPMGLEIEAPNLVFLKYHGRVVPFCLKQLHCFSQAELFYEGRTDDGRVNSDVKTSVDQLSHVKHLSVGSWFIQFIGKTFYKTGKQCSAFHNLKTLSWSGLLATKEDVFTLVAFLGDCPSLELLKLKFEYPFSTLLVREGEGPCFELAGEEPNMQVGCLHQLRKIELLKCEGHPCEMELIKLLFETAVALDTLSVFFAYSASELHAKELVEQVSIYSRASSHVQVKFFEEYLTRQ